MFIQVEGQFPNFLIIGPFWDVLLNTAYINFALGHTVSQFQVPNVWESGV